MKITLEKSETQTEPRNYYVITDTSGSMYSSIDVLKKTVQSMKNLLGPKDTISIAWFSDNFDWIVKGATINTNTFDQLIDRNIYSRGLTNYSDVLSSLSNVIVDVSLSTGVKNSSLIFLSDGHSNMGAGHARIIQICQDIQQLPLEARVIGYSNYYNRELLLDMAKAFKGQFSHISDHIELEQEYTQHMTNKKQIKNVTLDQKFDYLWQVSDTDIFVYQQNDDLSVDVLNTKDESQLFGLQDFEVENLIRDSRATPSPLLNDPKFVYSLATVLSKANKANLGVSILVAAGDTTSARMLQKAFTVSQKGRAENELQRSALTVQQINKTTVVEGQMLDQWLKELEVKIQKGQVAIDTKLSEYNNVTRKKSDVSKVKFVKSDGVAKIVEIKGNENRPNINLLTVRKGKITEILDKDLGNKLYNFNQNTDTPINLPIECESFKNYTLVSNGDFNFDALVLDENGKKIVIDPRQELSLFDSNIKNIDIKDFTNLNKNLIKTKAHVSVLNWYIKNNAEAKHRDDLRLKWGIDGAALLEEMGLDYKLRYSPEKEKTERDENADYIPMISIDAFIKGCSKISAKDSYQKMVDKKKPNALDEIMWVLFKKYDAMKNELGKQLFVKALQTELEGLTQTVKILSQEVANQKFYIISTNSWFTGVDKADEVIYDDLVIKTKIEKEYV